MGERAFTTAIYLNFIIYCHLPSDLQWLQQKQVMGKRNKQKQTNITGHDDLISLQINEMVKARSLRIKNRF